MSAFFVLIDLRGLRSTQSGNDDEQKTPSRRLIDFRWLKKGHGKGTHTGVSKSGTNPPCRSNASCCSTTVFSIGFDNVQSTFLSVNDSFSHQSFFILVHHDALLSFDSLCLDEEQKGQDRGQRTFAEQDLCRLQTTIHLAKEMGALLGRSHVLFQVVQCETTSWW